MTDVGGTNAGKVGFDLDVGLAGLEHPRTLLLRRRFSPRLETDASPNEAN